MISRISPIQSWNSGIMCQHVPTYGLVSWQIWHSHPPSSSRVLQTSPSTCRTCLHLAHLQTFSSTPGRGRFGRHWHPPQGRLRIVLCPLWPNVSAPLRRISYKVTYLKPFDSRKIQQICFQWTKALNLDCCTFQFHSWHAPRTLIWRHWRLSPWRGGEFICVMCMYPTAFWAWKV